jgi:predicted kinase
MWAGVQQSVDGVSTEVKIGPSVRCMKSPLLIVLAGRPGTGKTTLARALCARLEAVYVRVDAIEAAALRSGISHPIGPLGYFVAHEVATSNLQLGRDVVVDAVNPVPEARSGWRETAHASGSALVQLETTLPNTNEHRRRVENRIADMADQVVPRWVEVTSREWVPWDPPRDGPRTVIDTTALGDAVTAALRACQAARLDR